MSLSEIKSAIPDYAKDLRLNLDSVLTETGAPGLSAKQIGLIALASAIASRHEPLTIAVAADAAKSAAAQELSGARTASRRLQLRGLKKPRSEPSSPGCPMR